MAVVHFGSELRRYTGGTDTLQIDAPRVLELKGALEQRFPGIAIVLDQMAVALDGAIHNDPDYQPVAPGTEVHFVPRIAGGRPERRPR